ncbi:bumetanide-sensitive sodium-(potassium)-chloride cotransporter [Bemisia tabaci]|uniref:bumetanide-sensitive sodium-(potassium)-chloride cotransporter n=1 Tax=Bemisia tabaci TaxID=7038 RepID=UPI003B2866C0
MSATSYDVGAASEKMGVELRSMGNNKQTRFQVNRVGDDGDGGGADEVEHEEHDHLMDYEQEGGYAKSFRHLTREALPRMDNYRNIMSIQAAYRPTLDELHNQTLHHKNALNITMNGLHPSMSEGVVKFGWIKGVFIRNLLNIWGVMLFLRLSWVVAQAGIFMGCVLILSTTVVTLITALSMSAISTNGLIKGGGTYFMISRSLGPEFGASIGLIFSLANAVACAMYTVGFCESVQDAMGHWGLTIVDGGITDMRIIGSITIMLLLGIVVIGMEWEAKTQLGLLVILVLAIADFFIGAIMGPQSDDDIAKGFLGFNATLVKQNMQPDYRPLNGEPQDFFSVFAIFFPAASGFLAGANISGDLRDPQKAIPKGTILAIIVTTASYILMAIIVGMIVARDATGVVGYLADETFLDCYGNCKYGLHNNFQVMELVSAFGPLVYAGCFAATLSSALASLVSAPKVFQALCNDNLYPYISWFGRGYGKNNEPVRGYILTFFIAIAFILVGELNAIAPLISNFFLAAYALINFSTFHASLAKPVGWRPTFKYYNMWLSLIGAILCVTVMFLISWATALITFALNFALYLIVAYRKPDVNWGSSTQAQTYKSALSAVQQLSRVEDHVKNYRPQILLLTGLPFSRPPLVDFANLITKNLSLLICGHIHDQHLAQRTRSILTSKAINWFNIHRIKAFYIPVDDMDFETGAKSLMQASGLGKLKPNILMAGYKADWKKCKKEDAIMYFNALHKALDNYMGVCLLRVKRGLDYSSIVSEEAINEISANGGTASVIQTRQNSPESLRRNDQSFSQVSHIVSDSSESEETPPSSPRGSKTPRVSNTPNPDDEKSVKINMQPKRQKTNSVSITYKDHEGAELPKEILNELTLFQRKQKKGTIDVWWLYDDGGLTLLLPYIISTRQHWSSCKLRVFALANKKDELEFEQRNMASLLAKFRIDYSDLKMIPNIIKKPQEETQNFYNSLIKDLIVSDECNQEKENRLTISESELLAMKDKTTRHLRLRELLLEQSMESNLIVMTLPMPRKNIVSAALYLSWLETLTSGMPPFLLVRGNQTSVLTFYS